MTSGYPTAPRDHPDEKQHRRLLADAANRTISGKLNVTGSVTLVAGATETTITDARISHQSAILLQPTTANAADALSTTYIAPHGTGSAVVTHSNDAATDRAFIYVVIG